MDRFEDNQYHKLSSGWDCKYEQSAEKCYSPANYFTKTMQHVDPRQRYRLLENSYCSNESIALQRNETSPLSMIKITPNRRILTPQLMPRRCTIQETSLTQNMDTEIMVQKIQNMFPTAGENHIRLLLKKYYNREAVVISALQVEKHPVTMPGPYVTPPSKRNVFHNTPSSTSLLGGCRYIPLGSSHDQDLISLGYNNSGSPAQYYRITNNDKRIGHHHNVNQLMLSSSTHQATFKYPTGDIRSKVKVNSSPKMKLRYMKAIFPQVEETLIFDVLANADNNVQIATDKLMSKGYAKHDPSLYKNSAEKQRQEDIQNIQQKSLNIEKTFSLNTMRSPEEKDFLKKKLSEKYPCIVERILLMALESVNYDEERAKKILQIVQEEETERQISCNINSEPSNDHKSQNKEFNNYDIEISQLSKENDHLGINCENDINNLNSNINNTLSLSYKSSSLSSSLTSSSISSTLSPFMSTLGLLDALNRNSSSVNSYLNSTSTKSVSTSLWKIVTTNPPRIKKATLKKSQDSMIEILPPKESKPEANNKQINKQGSLAKGPNGNLLLADYVIWNGANPYYREGQKCMAVGPNAALRTERTYRPCGHNPKLCNGPQSKLVRGRVTN